MGTDLLQKPDSEEEKSSGFSDDTPQSIYDKEFDKVIKGNYSPEELKDLEEDSANKDSDADSEKDDLEEGGFYKGGSTGSSKKKSANGRRGLVIGGGIGALLISAVFAIMAFLPSFVATHIVESIENQIGQVPQYAVEKRMNYYMNKYLIMKTLGVGDFDGNDPRFVYMNNSVYKTLYTNWKGAKLEKTLIDDYDFKLEAKTQGITRDTMKAKNWTFTSGGKTYDLTAKEARQGIAEFARQETKSGQIWKRHRIRVIANNYYGVPNWKPFERTRESYEAKKLKFKQDLVTRTIGSVSDKYGKYINCLLEGGEKCKDIRKGEADANRQKADSNPEDEVDDSGSSKEERIKEDSGLDVNEAKQATSEAIEAGVREGTENAVGDTADRALSRQIVDSIQKIGMRKILASAAAGVGLIDTISQVVQSVENGNINIITYDKNISQYSAFAAAIISAADQIRSGEDFDPADIRLINEMFANFQESPAYQSAAGKIDTSKSIRRDCNNNGTKTDQEDQLAPGQVVCENKKVLQDKTAFTNNRAWSELVRISDGYEDTVGNVMDLVDGVTSWITSTVGIDAAIQSLMSALKLDVALSSAFQFVINTAIGPVATGAEVGADAYDATYAGMDALAASAGGGVGDRSSSGADKTIGGQYLNEQQIVAIKSEMQEQRDYELQNMNMFARYFSPSVPESITSQAIISSPTNLTSMAEKVSSVFSTNSLTSGVNNLFSKKVSAYDRNVNPFGVMQFGFPDDHPIFTANNGEGMDPDQVEAIYKCSLPVEQRPIQYDNSLGRPNAGNGYGFADGNKLPFDVPVQADPCLLEKAVEEAGSMLFTGTYDDEVDTGSNENQNTNTPTQTPGAQIVGNPFESSVDVACATGTVDLGIHTAYDNGKPLQHRLCAIPNISSTSSESQPGSSFYINGADGKVIVNSRVSGAVFSMATDAAAQGVVLKAASSFRTNEHQMQLWNELGRDRSRVAPPGSSNHQDGTAIDFEIKAPFISGASCKNRSRATGNKMWDWLFSNAEKYGYSQYAAEGWHWDPRSNGCTSTNS